MPSFAVLASLALAQDLSPTGGFDAHGFTLVADDGDVRDALTIERPGPWSQGDLWFAALSEYADRPLVQVIEPTFGDSAPVEHVVLDQVLALNLNAGVALHDRLRLDVTAPIYFLSLGLDGYQDPSVGDVRVSTMVSVLRPVHIVGGGGPGVGVSAHVDVPSGDPGRFLGQPGVAGGFAVSGTYEGPWYTLTAALGSQFNPTIDVGNLDNSDQFVAGGAINVLPGARTGITAETHLYAPFKANAISGAGMPAETILSLRHQLKDGVTFTFGGAAGISQGASAARYRAFLGVGYGKVKPPREADHDALVAVTVKDRCPDAIETPNGWKDDDGCPDELGTLSVRARFRGEDVEGGELIVTGPEGEKRYGSTERPAYKTVPGTSFRASASAPSMCLYGEATGAAGEESTEIVVELTPRLDSWADVEVVDPLGVPLMNPSVKWSSAAVTCLPEGEAPARPGFATVWTPMGPGKHHLVVEVPGYKVVEQDADVPAGGARIQVRLEPSRVILELTRIAILDKVFFEFNKAVIKSESFGLLDDVAAVIVAHPEVGRVQVEGHTDDKGNDAYNLKLSQQRADSVRAYLAGKGVEPERLVAVGFGEGRPIETNQTEAGRGENRRVEFNLIDQTPPPESTPGGSP